MNSQLMEILNVIQDGLSENSNTNVHISAADEICVQIVSVGKCGADIDNNISCSDCIIGYRTSKGYAAQIIQVFKNI